MSDPFRGANRPVGLAFWPLAEDAKVSTLSDDEMSGKMEAKLSVLLDAELTVRDLEMKIRDGVFTVHLVSGPEGGNPIYKLVAAMLWHLLLGEEDEMPPNYRTIEFGLRPAQERDEIRCTAAVLVPGAKSPHEMRMVAEARVESMETAIRRLIESRDETVGAVSDWWRDQLRGLLRERRKGNEQ